MDKQKSLLLDAYVKRAIAISKLSILSVLLKGKEEPIDTPPSGGTTITIERKQTDIVEELNSIYIDIGKFIDFTDTKVSLFSTWHAYMLGHYGRMTKYLVKIYEDKLQRDVIEETRNIAIERKWEHIVVALNKAIITANPGGYRLF